MIVETNLRLENERQLLALIINKNEVVDLLQVKPKYFMDKELGKMLEYCIELYLEQKTINPVEILKKHKDFNNSLFCDLLLNTFYHEGAWKEQLQINEENILKFYKLDIIKSLYKELTENKISYEDYMKKMTQINKYQINKPEVNMLNVSDIDMSKEEEHEYIKSQITTLDNAIKGFIVGEVSVWSGGNASAKSTFLNQIAIESINQNYKVAIYSGELIAKRLLRWIILQCAGKYNMSYNEAKNYWYVNSNAKEKILKWLDGNLFIYNNEASNKANEILLSIEECVKKNNIKVVILDNLMAMNLNNYGDNKYDVQSEFIKDLSALAKRLNIHIHFVCHPRKATNFLRKIDISGSADLTNVADNVFILHRVNNDFILKTYEMFKWKNDNDIYNFTNVIEVCKNRELGVEDYFIGMQFEKESKRLLNYKDEKKFYKWDSY